MRRVTAAAIVGAALLLAAGVLFLVGGHDEFGQRLREHRPRRR